VLGHEHSAFVAEADDGSVVGVLSVGESREEDGVGEIYVIYVQPGSWGSSAGQLLIERAHEVLAARHDEAELTVLADDPRARRFYERNGWALDELRSEEHFGGQPTEVARYRRELR
jgi:ribosomal protein S18 acetylase RimI-like enzyme